MSTLRASLALSFAEKYTLLLLGTGGAMALSRILSPADIGVYSVGAVLVGLAQSLRDFGVGPYVIQERELSAEKLRAALATSLLVAWTLAALVWLGSAALARFYHEPRLQTVLRLLSGTFVLLPYSSLSLPLLRREMRFAAIFAINAANSVAGLSVGLTLAWAGFGPLSLAWAALAGSAAMLAMSLLLRPRGLPWRPGVKGIGKILSFGAVSSGGGVIDELGVAAPDLIVGRLIDVGAVGLLSKAVGAVGVFNQAVSSAISPVVFPLFSACARDGGDARGAYLRTVAYVTALAWPFFLFLGLMAFPIVNIMYGPQWNATLPLIRIMCFSSALYSMFSMARYLFVATGHVKTQALLDALALPVRVAAVALAARYGLLWVAWAMLLGMLFRCWLTHRYLCALSGMRAALLWRAVAKSCWLTGGTGLAPAAVLAWMEIGPGRTWLPLALAGGGALLCWVGAAIALRHPIADEFAWARRKLLGPAAADPT